MPPRCGPGTDNAVIRVFVELDSYILALNLRTLSRRFSVGGVGANQKAESLKFLWTRKNDAIFFLEIAPTQPGFGVRIVDRNVGWGAKFEFIRSRFRKTKN